MEIIFDVDKADRELCYALRFGEPMPGVWGYKLGDLLLAKGFGALEQWGSCNIFVDLKHYDVAGRLARIIDLYNTLDPHTPKLLTVSGESSPAALTHAVLARGTIDIIVTTVLSDMVTLAATSRLNELVCKAIDAGAQGITCPAWLLPRLGRSFSFPLKIVATGVVSEGVNPRHHHNPRTVEYARDHGAAYAVVGTEVLEAPDPRQTLYELGQRASGKVGQMVDKVV